MPDSSEQQDAIAPLPEGVAKAIQSNLRQIAIQLGKPQGTQKLEEIYETAQSLLSHLSPDPLTVARLSGVLLVYQLSNPEPEEVEWFKSELQKCQDLEAIEELIDSIASSDRLS